MRCAPPPEQPCIRQAILSGTALKEHVSHHKVHAFREAPGGYSQEGIGARNALLANLTITLCAGLGGGTQMALPGGASSPLPPSASRAHRLLVEQARALVDGTPSG